MKSVMISIRPKWCELIATGEKTVEVRKTRPKIDTPFKVYIYETLTAYNSVSRQNDGLRPHLVPGKVIGEFVCDEIMKHSAELWDDDTHEDIRTLFTDTDGEEQFYIVSDNGDDDWERNPLVNASQVSIEELREYLGKGIHEFYCWIITDLKIYNNPLPLSTFGLKRPFQSWGYVNDEEV